MRRWTRPSRPRRAAGKERVARPNVGNQHATELALWPGAVRKPGPRGQDRAPVPGSWSGGGNGAFDWRYRPCANVNIHTASDRDTPAASARPSAGASTTSGRGRRRDRGCRITPGGPGEHMHAARSAGNNGTLIGGSGLGVGHPPHRQSEPAPIRTASGMEGRSPDELAMPSRVAVSGSGAAGLRAR